VSGPADISARDLADLVGRHIDTALLAFDVDGVLAPLVDHADEAALLPGVRDGLTALAARTAVAIVSGRALESLERLFAFPVELHVIGSNGLEVRGGDEPVLDDDEQYTFDQLEIIGTRGVDAAGQGAWLEYKPASVVLHTRKAEPGLAVPAIAAVTNLAGMIDGAQVKPGSDASPVVYLGDDVTDEDAFGMMAETDVSVHVGPGDSAAVHRLHGPPDVAEFLASLT